MNRIQFIILSNLLSESADNNIGAMSIKEIIESLHSLDYTYNSLYKHVEVLLAAGYVAAGLPVGNAKTYYITQKGVEALDIMKGENGK